MLVEPVPPSEPAGLTPGDPLAGLDRWLAEGRVDEAARARARQRWLERQAAEDATLAGVLQDLAERAAPVTVRTIGGHVLRGPVVALGADFAVVRLGRAGDAFVPLAHIATVRPAPGAPAAAGDRPVTAAVVLAEVLVEMAPDRPDVVAVTGGDDARGRLLRAGRDVVTISLDTAGHDTTHVATAAIDHLVVRG